MTTTSVTSFDPSWHVTPTDIALDNRQDPQRSRHRPSRLLLPDWHSHDTSCCKNWHCNNPDTGDMGQRWLRAVHKDASIILGIAVGKSGERNMTLPAHSRLTHNPCTRHAHRLSAQQHYYEYDYYFPSTSIIMITSSIIIVNYYYVGVHHRPCSSRGVDCCCVQATLNGIYFSGAVRFVALTVTILLKTGQRQEGTIPKNSPAMVLGTSLCPKVGSNSEKAHVNMTVHGSHFVTSPVHETQNPLNLKPVECLKW